MAKYRYVYTNFWNDPDVLENFTPEDKIFYLYLLTNKNTSQIGIYEITRKQMAFEIGYSLEAVNAIMDRFINKHELILYDEETREVCIKNWGKYNLFKGGEPIANAIASDIAKVRNATFLRYPAMHAKANDIKALFDAIPDTCPTRGEKENKSKTKVNIKEKKEYTHSANANAIEDDFEIWWDLYDKKVDKKKSLAAFKRCHKKHGFEVIERGTKGYLYTIDDRQFQKYPTTFLNGESYLDVEGYRQLYKEKLAKEKSQSAAPMSFQQKMRDRPGEKTPDWMNEKPKPKPKTETQKQAADDPEFAAMISEFRNK